MVIGDSGELFTIVGMLLFGMYCVVATSTGGVYWYLYSL